MSNRDIEEQEETLEQTEQSSLQFWEKKQRELVTSVVDYNLGTLTELVREGDIDLSPNYQRRFRWDAKRQSKLIESFLMNVPVPPIFLNEDKYGKYSVIDGKQRLTAISSFFSGRLRLEGLEVFGDVNGMTIDDMPSRLRSVLKTRPTIRAIIILRQSDEDVKYEVFRRINTGGVRLNNQEIRNSVYPGPLNDLILILSENNLFHKLLHVKNKRSSAIYQEMRDAEFVLRYFTFAETWENFSGGMKRHLDNYMARNQFASDEKINELGEGFFETLTKVEVAFGSHAYQRWQPEKKAWRKQVLASLFDAQMFAVKDFPLELIERNSKKILEASKTLYEDADFRRSIDAATNTPALFKSRISQMRDFLRKIVG